MENRTCRNGAHNERLNGSRWKFDLIDSPHQCAWWSEIVKWLFDVYAIKDRKLKYSSLRSLPFDMNMDFGLEYSSRSRAKRRDVIAWNCNTKEQLDDTGNCETHDAVPSMWSRSDFRTANKEEKKGCVLFFKWPHFECIVFDFLWSFYWVFCTPKAKENRIWLGFFIQFHSHISHFICIYSFGTWLKGNEAVFDFVVFYCMFIKHSRPLNKHFNTHRPHWSAIVVGVWYALLCVVLCVLFKGSKADDHKSTGREQTPSLSVKGAAKMAGRVNPTASYVVLWWYTSSYI